MIRSSFKPKAPPRERRDRSDEFANFTPKDRQAARCSQELTAALAGIANMPAPPTLAKVRGRVNNAIRESARDERCLILFAGCRTHAIWSHNRHGRAGKGRGVKALDILGCYACTHCDAIYDGAVNPMETLTREQIELRWYAAHDQSLVKLARKGLL